MSNPEATAEAIESVSNMSFEELVAQREARYNQEPETESEEQPEELETESEEEEVPAEQEETEAEEEAEEEEEEPESEVDLLSLDSGTDSSLSQKGQEPIAATHR